MIKPQQAAAMPNDRWQAFATEMGTYVRAYQKDGRAAYALLLIPFGILMLIVGILIPMDCDDEGTDISESPPSPPAYAPPPPMLPEEPENCKPVILYMIHVPFIFLSIALLLCCSCKMKPYNEAIDQKIIALCTRYSDASVTFQYVTQFTGVCKPKGAQTYRALYIIPGGMLLTPAAGGGFQCAGTQMIAAGTPVQSIAAVQPAVPVGMQTMGVTVPPGVKPGESIQISTPSGPMQVVVPQGVSGGMAFQVQVPAAPMAQATAVPMAMATPVA